MYQNGQKLQSKTPKENMFFADHGAEGLPRLSILYARA